MAAKTLTQRFNELEEALQMEKSQNEYLQESYSQAVNAVLNMGEEGWIKLTVNGQENVGYNLGQLHEVSYKLREFAVTNALLVRGHDLRCAYMFGKGYNVTVKDGTADVSVRAQKLIDNQINQDAVFSKTALKANEKERFTNGGLFLLFDKTKSTFQRIPFQQIADAVTDPDNPEIVWYYERKWTRMVADPNTGVANPVPMDVWYKTDKAIAAGAQNYTKFRDAPVDPRYIMVDDIVNRPAGSTWGVPDSMTAAPWALSYSSYLKDGVSVLAALAAWTWKLTPKTAKGGEAAGAAIKSSQSKAATVVTDMDMAALPKAGTVDLADGRPIAAMAATVMAVDVSDLLADTADQGGRSAAPMDDNVAVRVLEERQGVNGTFLERCLKLLGVTSPCVQWAKMLPDADYRSQQSIVAALGTGAFWGDEIREPLAKVANIELLHATTPPGFMLPNNSKSATLLSNDQNAVPQPVAGSQAQPTVDGATSLTNAQGKSNQPTANKGTNAPAQSTAKPSSGNNDLRKSGGRAG